MPSTKGSESDEPHRSVVSKLWESFTSSLGGAVRDAIPSDDAKAYHPHYFFPLSIAILFAILGVFLGLFIPTITNELNNRFLSPAVSADKYCDMVSISNSGVFLATKSGDWQGSDNFRFSETTYAFSMTNLMYTKEEYAESMAGIFATLQEVGRISANYDLGTALTFWMSFVLLPPGTQSQRFYLHADPAVIFKREKVTASIGSINGTCVPSSTLATYQAGFGLLTMSMDFAEMQADPVCVSAITPSYFGYIPEVDRGLFQVSLDVRSLVTSLAVNVGIITLDDIVEVAGTAGQYPYVLDGVPTVLNFSTYYDPRYPQMTPVLCWRVPEDGCIAYMGSTATLPMFGHSGRDKNWPAWCDCTDPTLGDLTDPTHACNVFSFISGVLFYNTPDVSALFELGLKYSVSEVSYASFFPMFIASSFGENSVNYDELHSQQTLHDVYDFCYLPGHGHCRFLTFTTFDVTVVDYSVNEYFNQLRNGACRDTFSTTAANWQKLADVPFAPLTQEYAVCRESMYNAVINSVGVTAGNISLLTPLIILLVLTIAASWQYCRGAWPKGYHQSDKGDILDQLATLLLLLRDHKLHTDGSNSVPVRQLQISRISKELHLLSRQLVKQYDTPEQHAKRSRGYWFRMYSKLKRSSKPDEEKDPVEVTDGEQMATETDEVKMHYGHYELVPAKALSIEEQV